MKVVFVSGPYRGNVSENIAHAREASIRLWQAGYAVFCPHMNTAHFDGLCHDDVWLKGDIEILKRCDAAYFLNTWRQSEGSRIEHKLAQELGLECLYEELL